MGQLFEAPSFAEEFLQKTSSRGETLIKAGVWDFNVSQLRSWIKNFKSPEAQYLCAHLLDSLIYRSERMTTSLCKHAVHSILPNSLNAYPEDLSKWILKMGSPAFSGFCFVAVEGIKRGERQSAKSGQTVLRMYDRAGVAHKNHFIDASYLLDKLNSNNYKHIVFVDDFCGTGTQFSTFYNHFGLSNIPQNINQYYIPFACHEEAISQKLKLETPQVKVSPVELLDEDNRFFSEKYGSFRGDKLNSVNTARNFYQAFLNDNNIKIEHPFGFGGLELSYGWSKATPNNTLPIFYTEQSKWTPLLTR